MERITKQRHVHPFWAVGGAITLLFLALLSWTSVWASPAERVPLKDGEMEAYGRIDSFPAALIGTWVVDGVSYEADASTHFKQEAGSFAVDVCVKVAYFADRSPLTIREVETENDSDCDGHATETPEDRETQTPLPDPDSTPEAKEAPDDDDEVYGRIDTFPADLTGDWVVNGTTYTANSNSEFNQEHGSFADGVCVKIHADRNTSPPAIREIETEHDYRCGNGSTSPATPAGEMFGAIQSFPEGLIGAWNIGGMSFIADNATEFDQEGTPFDIGVTVKVHFVTEQNGANRAREIEAKFKTDNDDEDGDGEFEGAEGHAFGAIETFPAGRTGAWRIGGVTYTATERTRFEAEDGDFAVGAQVKIEYVTQGNDRVARKIETTSDNGDVSNDEHFKVFGFVRSMPASGFVGAWTIDDSPFVADATSRFKEEHGLLGIGAFVSVEYSMQGDDRLIYQLESHVPPGAGPDDSVGNIDDLDGALSAAAVQQNVWTIGGLAYQITAATNLNDAAAPLDVGVLVAVNSYSDGNGSRIATQVRSISTGTQIFLPVVIR